MRHTETHPNFDCPVQATLHVIGGRWKALLLFHLWEGGTLRFNQFRRLVPGITLQSLTSALRELEADGVVHREVYAQVPPKVEYSLTERGRTLRPILQAMCEWGVAFGPTLFPGANEHGPNELGPNELGPHEGEPAENEMAKV